MRVYGEYISDDTANAAMKTMLDRANFTYGDLQAALISHGVPFGYVCSRAADRLLQKYRKRGDIRWDSGMRRWVKQK